jgi:hypothetical protein
MVASFSAADADVFVFLGGWGFGRVVSWPWTLMVCKVFLACCSGDREARATVKFRHTIGDESGGGWVFVE